MTLPIYAMNQANFPEMYERHLVEPLFRPWAELLLKRVPLAPADRVLDVACGTGIVARLAKERLGPSGRVVGLDLSPQMLAVAGSIAPSVEWREGNAGALPFDASEKFDVVLSQQGLQFFPDKPAAAREMRRVLVKGGRLAITTWRPLEEVPFFRDLHRVAERHLGPFVDHRNSLGDATVLEGLLGDAGFEDVRVETVTLTTRFSDAASIVSMNTMAVVGMGLKPGTVSDDERAKLIAAIGSDSTSVLAPYTDGSGIAFAMGTNLATARG